MQKTSRYTINLGGYLINLDTPKIMGILNVTPDSFHDGGKYLPEKDIGKRIEEILIQGGEIIDIGGCSTRPGFSPPSLEEEWGRVKKGLDVLSQITKGFPVSIDSFRPEIIRRSYDFYGPLIINDISGGGQDCEMWELASQLHLPYILTHNGNGGENNSENCEYKDVTAEVLKELSWKINSLREMGVCDVIIDPGIGFGKNSHQNFQLMNELEEFAKTNLPLMVGISRKSMISNVLGREEENTLTGTISLNTIALIKGANILRVHDVKEATSVIKITQELKNSCQRS